ncbi:MAG TPA: ABC transporter permease subunit [Anaerolineales bacterium]|nr:ABC transporter permease subunit [Anaerolineales bacterium]
MKRVMDIFSKILNPRSDLSELSGLLSDEDFVAERVERRRKSLLKAVFTNVPLLLGTVIILVLFLVVLFGPALAPQNPYLTGQPIAPHFDRELGEFIQPPLPPSSEFPLGTDQWGIDLLSLLMHGARNTLVACAFITMARVILGLALGGLAGWNEGRAADQIVMGIIGVITSLPLLVSSMILIFALDIRGGLPVFIVALSIIGWTEIAQYTRSEFLVLKKMPYIEGAESVGLPALATAVRHVLPNVLPQLLVITFLEMGAVMMLLGELGFVGVYIGGGSRISIEVAIEVNQIFQLVEIPEWGAMLAEGFRYLRSKPFVVFPPALAFFISVLGFNTLGEGLRRHIEVYGLNTALLLRKRMLLIVVALSVATVYIIQRTGPAPWFTKVAMAFNGERAYQEAQTLAEMSGRGHGQEGGTDAVDYIAERFESFGLDPGRMHNSYIYSIDAQLVRPIQQPELALLNPDGSEAVKFIHQKDFGFVIAGHGGDGQVEASLTFIGFRGTQEPSPQAYKGLDLQGKIVLLQEGNAPEDFPTEALIRGAKGILWIKQQSGDTLRSEMVYIGEEHDFVRSPTLPIFQIGPTVAQMILSNDGLTIPDLFQIEAVDAIGDGWFRRDLASQIRMRLELSEPQDYQIQNVIGFRPGSDFDHAGQLIVLFASYDGLGIDPDGTVYPAANHNGSGVAVLLEIAHLWQEQSLDPRRPVLFIAWGTGTQEFAGVDEFFADTINFRHLTSMNPNARVLPEVVINLDAVGAGESVLQVTGNAPGRYLDILRETVAEREVDLVAPEAFAQSSRIGLGTGVPWMHLGWVHADLAPQEDVIGRLNVGRVQDFGEVFALMMAKIVRQTNY